MSPWIPDRWSGMTRLTVRLTGSLTYFSCDLSALIPALSQREREEEIVSSHFDFAQCDGECSFGSRIGMGMGPA